MVPGTVADMTSVNLKCLQYMYADTCHPVLMFPVDVSDPGDPAFKVFHCTPWLQIRLC